MNIFSDCLITNKLNNVIIKKEIINFLEGTLKREKKIGRKQYRCVKRYR